MSMRCTTKRNVPWIVVDDVAYVRPSNVWSSEEIFCDQGQEADVSTRIMVDTATSTIALPDLRGADTIPPEPRYDFVWVGVERTSKGRHPSSRALIENLFHVIDPSLVWQYAQALYDGVTRSTMHETGATVPAQNTQLDNRWLELVERHLPVAIRNGTVAGWTHIELMVDGKRFSAFAHDFGNLTVAFAVMRTSAGECLLACVRPVGKKSEIVKLRTLTETEVRDVRVRPRYEPLVKSSQSQESQKPDGYAFSQELPGPLKLAYQRD